MNIKLDTILLKMIEEVLDLEKTNEPIGAPIDRANKAIQKLFEKLLKEKNNG